MGEGEESYCSAKRWGILQGRTERGVEYVRTYCFMMQRRECAHGCVLDCVRLYLFFLAMETALLGNKAEYGCACKDSD